MLYSALLDQWKCPALYAKSAHPFWNDEHISKGMLAAHLDPNIDAATRKPSFLDSSVRWIGSLLPPKDYPTLLDLGCGPGLYAQRFARAGYAVTGVDLSPRSIAYGQETAQKEGLPIRYHCADYLSLALPTQFDLAVMIYCDYSALSTEDRLTLLRRASAHLRPGGRFLLDVDAANAFRSFEETRYWSLCEQGGYWAEEPYLALEQQSRFCDNVTLHQASILTENGLKTYYIWQTYFSVESFGQEAAQVGFKVLGHWADVAGTPYREASPTLTFLLEKPQ